jgi:SAM-dependent methyltransferase
MTYAIHPGYIARSNPDAWDDTVLPLDARLAAQREVYEYARAIASDQGCRRILDVGCGSGAKLIHWFPPSEFEVIGVELAPTLAYLQKTYLERRWISLDQEAPSVDFVICADVIEHLSDPDQLLDYIARTGAKWIVISTPDRDSLDNHFGPPRNPCHVREWSMPEFREYISIHFEVSLQFTSAQKAIEDGGATQVVLCRMGEIKP